MKVEELIPGVELLESMRSVGYTFQSAIADLVDNSITAGASHVWIIGDAVNGAYVSVLDDGRGMDGVSAREALTLAGTATIRNRSEHDLGRFGLGLKTASLSQGRVLTVITKNRGTETGIKLDLDFVLSTGKWSVQILDAEERAQSPSYSSIKPLESGTLVVWEKLDYLLSKASNVSEQMSEQISKLYEHLGLTFQRIIEQRGDSKLNVVVNGRTVKPIDPFLSTNPATQTTVEETLRTGSSVIRVQGYTLPHSSKLQAADLGRTDLGKDMRNFQGFYVYRNERLIVHGSWFGLAKKEELRKLSRVRIDIPNSMDQEWQLDIKKSQAQPPQAVRNQLRRLMDRLLIRSERVYTFRGRRDFTDTSMEHMWVSVTEREGFRIDVNDSHPLVVAMLKKIPMDQHKSFLGLLKELSRTYPTDELYSQMASNKIPVASIATEPELREQLSLLIPILNITVESVDEAANRLRSVQPFDQVQNLKQLLTSILKGNN